MADTDIAITAGTGTKIDTRTVGAGVDEHRQVVVVGDPTTAAGVAPVDATAGLKVDTELPAAAALSDTIANPTSPMVGAGGMFYNGTDWRRARQAPAGATNESPTGIGFGAIALHHAGGSGEYHPLKAASFEGPTSSGDSILVNHPYWHTGATFVRASGDATNGLDVDVTRTPRVTTATLANVAASATSVTIDALNTARLGLMLQNDSTSVLYLKYGTTASATDYTVKIPPDTLWEMPEPCYTGRIDGIWVTANGNARVTEMTA